MAVRLSCVRVCISVCVWGGREREAKQVAGGTDAAARTARAGPVERAKNKNKKPTHLAVRAALGLVDLCQHQAHPPPRH
jgi:hypothetical protein